jgi:hypothetical protein
MKALLILSACLALGGCATNVGAHTASGRPETVARVSADTARAKITSGMLNRGWSLRSDTNTQLTFTKRGTTGTRLITAEFGAKASFILVPQGGGVRVVSELSGVGFLDTNHETPMLLMDPNGGRAARADVDAVLASL